MTGTRIEALELAFSYGDRPVIERVNLAVSPGEFVAIIGPNGAGKTTLLHLLLGLHPARAGRVLLRGDDIAGLRRPEIARRAALVPQEPIADFAFTVREVVAMGRTPYLGRFEPERDRDLRAIEEALRATETETLAARPISELSGGERQRAHLARALAQETDVLVLDEPTANLDVEHQLQILALLRTLSRRGKSVVVALHDLSLAARFCDRLLVVADRTIVADGPPEQVLTEENLARYFRIVARVERAPGGGVVSVVPLSPTGP